MPGGCRGAVKIYLTRALTRGAPTQGLCTSTNVCAQIRALMPKVKACCQVAFISRCFLREKGAGEKLINLNSAPFLRFLSSGPSQSSTNLSTAFVDKQLIRSGVVPTLH